MKFMKDLNKIKKFASKSSLSLPEIMWINYAEDLGLNITYIDEIFINKDNSNKYNIIGLFWKYSAVKKINDNIFNNELYIGLRRDFTDDYANLTNKTNKNVNTNFNQYSTITNNILNHASGSSFGSTTSVIVPNTVDTVCYSSTHSSFSDIYNKIENINKENTVNPIIEDAPSDECYFSIPEFTEHFTLNGKELNKILKTAKFEIKIIK